MLKWFIPVLTSLRVKISFSQTSVRPPLNELKFLYTIVGNLNLGRLLELLSIRADECVKHETASPTQ